MLNIEKIMENSRDFEFYVAIRMKSFDKEDFAENYYKGCLWEDSLPTDKDLVLYRGSDSGAAYNEFEERGISIYCRDGCIYVEEVGLISCQYGVWMKPIVKSFYDFFKK